MHAWPKAKEVVHFTAWTQSATEMAFSWIKSTSHFYSVAFFYLIFEQCLVCMIAISPFSISGSSVCM